MSQRTQTFHFDGEFLGLNLRPLHEYRKNQWVIPVGYVFVCQWCGDAWAKIETARTCAELTNPASSRNFFIIQRPCMMCGGSGTMWLPYDTDYQRNLPQFMLLRELEIAYSDATANPRRRI